MLITKPNQAKDMDQSYILLKSNCCANLFRYEALCLFQQAYHMYQVYYDVVMKPQIEKLFFHLEEEVPSDRELLSVRIEDMDYKSNDLGYLCKYLAKCMSAISHSFIVGMRIACEGEDVWPFYLEFSDLDTELRQGIEEMTSGLTQKALDCFEESSFFLKSFIRGTQDEALDWKSLKLRVEEVFPEKEIPCISQPKSSKKLSKLEVAIIAAGVLSKGASADEKPNCNHESSGLVVKNEVRSEPGFNENIYGTFNLKPGFATCFTIGNQAFRLAIAELPYPIIPVPDFSCLTLIEGITTDCFKLKDINQVQEPNEVNLTKSRKLNLSSGVNDAVNVLVTMNPLTTEEHRDNGHQLQNHGIVTGDLITVSNFIIPNKEAFKAHMTINSTSTHKGKFTYYDEEIPEIEYHDDICPYADAMMLNSLCTLPVACVSFPRQHNRIKGRYHEFGITRYGNGNCETVVKGVKGPRHYKSSRKKRPCYTDTHLPLAPFPVTKDERPKGSDREFKLGFSFGAIGGVLLSMTIGYLIFLFLRKLCYSRRVRVDEARNNRISGDVPYNIVTNNNVIANEQRNQL